MEQDTFRGLPVFWRSENNAGIIVYDQWAFSGKYKLYINSGNFYKYDMASDFIGKLIAYAKNNYYLK